MRSCGSTGGLRPGFSGAAFAHMRGQVMGVCTSALARSAGILIPATTVTRITDEPLAKKYVSRGYLGAGTQPVNLSEAWIKKMTLSSDHGLLIVSLAANGPAKKAGVLIGDVLIELDGEPCRDVDDLHAALSSGRIGQPLKIGLIRGGERHECASSSANARNGIRAGEVKAASQVSGGEVAQMSPVRVDATSMRLVDGWLQSDATG